MNTTIIDLENPLWVEILQKLRHDIYHLPEYIYLESQRTNTIPKAIFICEGKKMLFVPYLLRRCDDIFNKDLAAEEIFDAVYRIQRDAG